MIFGGAQDNAREWTYSPNRHLQVLDNSNLDLEGVMQNVSPSIETVFQLLGTSGRWPKLTMSLLFDDCITPGVQIWTDDQHLNRTWISMDLPNVMERCWELCTSETGKDVEILWKCQWIRKLFAKVEGYLERKDGRLLTRLMRWMICILTFRVTGEILGLR